MLDKNINDQIVLVYGVDNDLCASSELFGQRILICLDR